MYPCKKCLNNNWKIENRQELYENKRYKWVEATCNVCGNFVEFGHSSKIMKQGKCAEYEIRDNKHYLKIDGKFVRVAVFRVNNKGLKDVFGKFLKVLPVEIWDSELRVAN